MPSHQRPPFSHIPIEARDSAISSPDSNRANTRVLCSYVKSYVKVAHCNKIVVEKISIQLYQSTRSIVEFRFVLRSQNFVDILRQQLLLRRTSVIALGKYIENRGSIALSLRGFYRCYVLISG